MLYSLQNTSKLFDYLFEMATDISPFKKQFDEQLTCSICLEQYTKPKTLPCHHSFCLNCIELLPTEKKVSEINTKQILVIIHYIV